MQFHYNPQHLVIEIPWKELIKMDSIDEEHLLESINLRRAMARNFLNDGLGVIGSPDPRTNEHPATDLQCTSETRAQDGS